MFYSLLILSDLTYQHMISWSKAPTLIPMNCFVLRTGINIFNYMKRSSYVTY